MPTKKTSRNTKSRQSEPSIQTKAAKIEAMLSSPATGKRLLYALKSLVFELSIETSIGVDHPGIAGVFFKVAAERGPLNEREELCFRHLDALLNSPNYETANALMNYWDDCESPKSDPFPGQKEVRHAS